MRFCSCFTSATLSSTLLASCAFSRIFFCSSSAITPPSDPDPVMLSLLGDFVFVALPPPPFLSSCSRFSCRAATRRSNCLFRKPRLSTSCSDFRSVASRVRSDSRRDAFLFCSSSTARFKTLACARSLEYSVASFWYLLEFSASIVTDAEDAVLLGRFH
uniref:Putative secreted protein n=1 Tax=Anopheles triannulatus TaxID=58253 RepID=A0A2M4B4B0_9DIPT